MKRHVLITGEPGVGKSTLLSGSLQGLTKPPAGFVTKEVAHNGKRFGFRVVNLQTGENRLLAHANKKYEKGRPRVGRYYVFTEVVSDMLCPIIRNGVAEGKPLIIDEIGSMGLLAGEVFTSAVLAAFDRDIPTVATIHTRPYEFTDALKWRSDITVWHVTEENRDQLTQELGQLIRYHF